MEMNRIQLASSLITCLFFAASAVAEIFQQQSPYCPVSTETGSMLCATDVPSSILWGISKTQCSLECLSGRGSCSGFNYNTTNQECDLYNLPPTGFRSFNGSSDCTHYQPQQDSYRGSKVANYVQNCSFPFTYLGKIYYKCIQTVYDAANLCNKFMCVDRLNVSMAICDSSVAGYVAKYSFVEVNITTFNTSTNVSSINGWLVIHQKLNDVTNFNVTWAEYKAGFGTPAGNFWLGLEKMHQLTSNGTYKIRFELQSSMNTLWYSAEYDTFWIDDETHGYALHVNGYSGDAGDSLHYTGKSMLNYHDGMPFSTWDRDNDKSAPQNCASKYGAGNWYNSCFYFLVTGSAGNSQWDSFKDMLGISNYVVRASRMMVKQV